MITDVHSFSIQNEGILGVRAINRNRRGLSGSWALPKTSELEGFRILSPGMALGGNSDWFIRPPMNSTKDLQVEIKAEDLTALMEAVAAHKDKSSFARLFNYFAPKVRAYMLRLGADAGAADDLVQDVMLTVWRRAPQFDPAKAGVGTWIFTIARNRRIDVIRKERRPEIDPNDPALVANDAPSADAALQQKRDQSSVRAAISELPEAQAQILRLAFFEDLSHGEIANELDLPLGTIKSRIRLATEKLRTKLSEIG